MCTNQVDMWQLLFFLLLFGYIVSEFLMMKAVVFHIASETFEVKEVPIPNPGSDEIRVKCLATALNPVDAKVCKWKGMLSSDLETIHLGLDVCGVVDSVGSSVNGINVGDLVLYHGRMTKQFGGFAEYAIHDALTTVVIDDKNFNPVVLAASPCAAWTAFRAFHDKLGVSRNVSGSDAELSLAITGASGGVGSFAIQFAKLAGLKTIIAICSKKNHDFVKKLGATEVIDYNSETITEGIKRVTNNEGIDLVLDCVGADTSREAAALLKFDGKICPIVSFAEGDIRGFLNSTIYAQISLGGAHSAGIEPRKRLANVGREITKLILNNQLHVPVTKVIGLEQVPDTLKEMLNANNTGKIVLKF